MKILVVDDEKNILKLYEAELKERGVHGSYRKFRERGTGGV